MANGKHPSYNWGRCFFAWLSLGGGLPNVRQLFLQVGHCGCQGGVAGGESCITLHQRSQYVFLCCDRIGQGSEIPV